MPGASQMEAIYLVSNSGTQNVSWEKFKIPYTPGYGLNSTPNVLIKGDFGIK